MALLWRLRCDSIPVARRQCEDLGEAGRCEQLHPRVSIIRTVQELPGHKDVETTIPEGGTRTC